jgi:uncharacterized protein
MTEITAYQHGQPSWADLSTTDPAGGRAFYAELFGWEANDVPAGEGVVYTMFTKGGKDAAALSGMRDDQKAAGMHPVWNLYVTVSDVDATAAKVEQAGGKILAPPFDVLDSGRMATIQDPSGAILNLWQAGTSIGAEVRDEPGSLSWVELLSHDPEAAKAFFAEVFSWRAEEVDMPSGPYTLFYLGERTAGGMSRIQPEWGDFPSTWYPYFEVADADLAVKRAEELGGSVEVPLQTVPMAGRFAMLHDPQGSHFWVITSEPTGGEAGQDGGAG